VNHDLLLLLALALGVLLVCVILTIGYLAHHRAIDRRNMADLNTRLNYIQRIGD
jgi:hypothetical protein